MNIKLTAEEGCTCLQALVCNWLPIPLNSSKHGTVIQLHREHHCVSIQRPRFLWLHRWSLPLKATLNTTGISSSNTQLVHSYCLVPLQNHHTVLPALLPLPGLAPRETLWFRSRRPVFLSTDVHPRPRSSPTILKSTNSTSGFPHANQGQRTPENRFLETNFTRPCACPPSQPGISAT